MFKNFYTVHKEPVFNNKKNAHLKVITVERKRKECRRNKNFQ